MHMWSAMYVYFAWFQVSVHLCACVWVWLDNFSIVVYQYIFWIDAPQVFIGHKISSRLIFNKGKPRWVVADHMINWIVLESLRLLSTW